MLRRDACLDSSEHLEDDTSLADDSDTLNSLDDPVPNDSTKLRDFMIVESADLDDNSDFDPHKQFNSDYNDDNGIVGRNVTEIQSGK